MKRFIPWVITFLVIFLLALFLSSCQRGDNSIVPPTPNLTSIEQKIDILYPPDRGEGVRRVNQRLKQYYNTLKMRAETHQDPRRRKEAKILLSAFVDLINSLYDFFLNDPLGSYIVDYVSSVANDQFNRLSQLADAYENLYQNLIVTGNAFMFDAGVGTNLIGCAELGAIAEGSVCLDYFELFGSPLETPETAFILVTAMDNDGRGSLMLVPIEVTEPLSFELEIEGGGGGDIVVAAGLNAGISFWGGSFYILKNNSDAPLESLIGKQFIFGKSAAGLAIDPELAAFLAGGLKFSAGGGVFVDKLWLLSLRSLSLMEMIGMDLGVELKFGVGVGAGGKVKVLDVASISAGKVEIMNVPMCSGDILTPIQEGGSCYYYRESDVEFLASYMAAFILKLSEAIPTDPSKLPNYSSLINSGYTDEEIRSALERMRKKLIWFATSSQSYLVLLRDILGPVQPNPGPNPNPGDLPETFIRAIELHKVN